MDSGYFLSINSVAFYVSKIQYKLRWKWNLVTPTIFSPIKVFFRLQITLFKKNIFRVIVICYVVSVSVVFSKSFTYEPWLASYVLRYFSPIYFLSYLYSLLTTVCFLYATTCIILVRIARMFGLIKLF